MQQGRFDTKEYTDLGGPTALQTQDSHTTFSSISTSKTGEPGLPEAKPVLLDHATPPSMVSAFCRAVFSKLVPDNFWGEGDIMNLNKSIIMKNIDHFIHLRRFESLTLHQVMQGMKVWFHR